MKKILTILTVLLAAAAISGCLNHEDTTGFTPETPVISFEEESINVEKGGGEFTITINSNLPWRIKSNVSWVTFDISNGNEGGDITLKVARNRLREERTATLTAWVTEDSKADFSIVQAPAEATESITYHVKVDGDGLASGASWEEATTLPTAIDAAGDGDVILLAAGSYSPVALIDGGETPEERTFHIHSNFTIEGGYPADAVTGAAADPSANETTLSGNLGSTQAYHVVVISAPQSNDNKVILKNLTIRDGKGYSKNKEIYRYAGESSFDAGEGAGMSIGVCNVEMTNCHIIGNTGTMAGGCIIPFGANVVFDKCSINENSVTGNGGGIWNEGNITMYDCTIANNRADSQCAGYYGVGGVARIYNTSIIGNDNTKTSGRSGGGAYLREGNGKGSETIFVNCTFTGNKSGNGGAVCIYGTSAVGASARFISCTVTGNTASNGGGICMYNATPTAEIYNSIISGNNSDIGLAGTVASTESQVLKAGSIIGPVLLNSEGISVSGWSFDAASMLGTLDYWNNSLTKTFPLVAGDKNPAIDQGMSAEELKTLAAGLADVDAVLVAKDQNGQDRARKSIGSYTHNN